LGSLSLHGVAGTIKVFCAFIRFNENIAKQRNSIVLNMRKCVRVRRRFSENGGQEHLCLPGGNDAHLHQAPEKIEPAYFPLALRTLL
jgi:hypothetical protein